jgi:serine/threonine protein kinase
MLLAYSYSPPYIRPVTHQLLPSILSLRHLNITRFHGYYDDPRNVYMVMNYAGKSYRLLADSYSPFIHIRPVTHQLLPSLALGNLHHYIHTVENGVVPLERARLYLRQVASALAYLGSAKIAHRDLKQENLVLTTRDTIQICDFGWAIHYHNEKRKTLCGTPLYVPPEMLRNVPYDPRFVDSWALGILAHELILDESPFDLQDKEWGRCSSDDNRAQRKIIFDKIEHFSEWKAPAKGESRAMTFIYALLQKDPKERMNAEDALGHPFLLDQESVDEKLPVFKTPNTRHTRRGQPALAKRRKLSRRDTERDSLSFDGKENICTLHLPSRLVKRQRRC